MHSGDWSTYGGLNHTRTVTVSLWKDRVDEPSEILASAYLCAGPNSLAGRGRRAHEDAHATWQLRWSEFSSRRARCSDFLPRRS
jgi:hypothetical protein